MNSSITRGFTLIEILMVVAIIGMLSSVILGAAHDSRLKAQDARVRAETRELANIMALERSETSDSIGYSRIQNGGIWKSAGELCSATDFLGNYAAKAYEICNSLVSAAGPTCTTWCTYFHLTSPPNPEKFTITTYLPYQSYLAGSARYLCFGSNGSQSINPLPVNPNQAASWTGSGCSGDPAL